MVRPIIVVGAPRSGTYLLGKLIDMNSKREYIGEVNELWKKNMSSVKYDTARPNDRKQEVLEKTRKTFEKRINCERGFIDKTPANTLRLPFVMEVFPEAKVIHVVRDGRSVAISAMNKYFSKNRVGKITKDRNEQLELGEKLRRAKKIAKKKVKDGVSIRYILKDAKHYLRNTMSVLGVIRKSMWGPRFPGWKEYFYNYSPLEMAIKQWQVCVESSMNALAANKDCEVLAVKYEELIGKPVKVVRSMLNFLETTPKMSKQEIEDSVVSGKRQWRQSLSINQKKVISNVAEETLARCGYKKTI